MSALVSRRLALLLIVVSLGVAAAPRVSAQRPRNVILISADTLRADHLGVYGYHRDTSPTLDRFARASVVFTRAVSHAPNTPPSQLSLLTSLYYSVHRFSGLRGRFAEWLVTLPQMLAPHGFATAGFLDGGYMSAEMGFDRGFEVFDDAGGHLDAILPKVERWLDTRDARPFFLFIHFYDVHSPYDPPPPYDTMFQPAPYTGDFEPTNDNLNAVVENKRRLTPEDVAYTVALYDGGIRRMDAQLEGFFDGLDRRGLLDSTAVIFTSDHGEEFMDHGSVLHWQTFFTPNLHVPLILRLPGRRGQRIDRVVEQIDVAPTVLELLGLPANRALMGRSLVPLLDGRGAPGTAFAEPFKLDIPWRTVVSDRYQLRYNRGTGERELYDVSRRAMQRLDPDEHAHVAARLGADLDAREQRIAARQARTRHSVAPAEPLGAAVRARLVELGYLR